MRKYEKQLPKYCGNRKALPLTHFIISSNSKVLRVFKSCRTKVSFGNHQQKIPDIYQSFLNNAVKRRKASEMGWRKNK